MEILQSPVYYTLIQPSALPAGLNYKKSRFPSDTNSLVSSYVLTHGHGAGIRLFPRRVVAVYIFAIAGCHQLQAVYLRIYEYLALISSSKLYRKVRTHQLRCPIGK